MISNGVVDLPLDAFDEPCCELDDDDEDLELDFNDDAVASGLRSKVEDAAAADADICCCFCC